MAIKRIIHTDEVNLKDWVDDRDEIMEGRSCCRDCSGSKKKCLDCYDFDMTCQDINSTYLEDEKINLNKELDNYVVAFAELGLWDGKKSGFKVLSTNLNSIFNVRQDFNTYYADAYNIRASCSHHDGTNFILYRKLKKGINVSDFEVYMYKNNYKLSSQQLSKYTESLLPYVKTVYGW